MFPRLQAIPISASLTRTDDANNVIEVLQNDTPPESLKSTTTLSPAHRATTAGKDDYWYFWYY